MVQQAPIFHELMRSKWTLMTSIWEQSSPVGEWHALPSSFLSFKCLCICPFLLVYLCLRIYPCRCVYLCLCICPYICICICLYTKNLSHLTDTRSLSVCVCLSLSRERSECKRRETDR